MELVELKILVAIETNVDVYSRIDDIIKEIKTIPNYISDIHYIDKIGKLKIIKEERYNPLSDTNTSDAWNLADEYKMNIDKSEGV